MTGPERTLRDELADVLSGCYPCYPDHNPVDRLLPVVQARADAARAEVAEAIAQAIEGEGATPDVDDDCSPVAVRHGLGLAARIAREHAATEGLRP